MMKYTIKKRETGSHFLINYEGELNPSQLEVARAPEGPVLVVAGAGSGKTRTLIYRLARLIESGVSPANILLLTFTRRAAQEMMRRASALIDDRCDRITGGTFHSVANLILRRWGIRVGLDPAFTILDRSDSEEVVQLLRQTLGLADKKRRFPRKGTLISMFGSSRNRDIPLDEVVERDYGQFSHEMESIIRLRELYESYKRQKHLADYDDLLARWLELLENHADVRETLNADYRHILVDEYQDTNAIQAKIVRLLATPFGNVMAVGDDAQSIYSFRGACFQNMFDFLKDYPGSRMKTLEENYRSSQKILDLANGLLDRAVQKHEKRLFSRKEGGMIPVLAQTPDESFQSRFICQKILELREDNVPLEEIAVLFRSSPHAFDLEIELARYNIPYIKRGGLKFMETAHVKDLLSYLRVVQNPKDAVGWTRILTLLGGVGIRTSQKLIQVVLESGSLAEGIFNLRKEGARKDLEALLALLEKIGQLPPAGQVEEAVRFYSPALKEKYDDFPKRLKDLDHLQVLSEKYSAIERFLSDVALHPPEESVAGVNGEKEEERLVLSTIHSAKGLEWKAVFVIWALDGKFPSVYSFNSEEELEEERRLLYVAVTRAKETLFLTYPVTAFDRASGMVLSRPSRFLEDLAPGLLEEWTIVPEAMG